MARTSYCGHTWQSAATLPAPLPGQEAQPVTTTQTCTLPRDHRGPHRAASGATTPNVHLPRRSHA